jgi:sugar lactone lactonase YvrE
MRRAILFLIMSLLVMTAGCASFKTNQHGYSLLEVAHSDRQWTGITVSRDSRIFVNYPRWSDNVPFSVGELKPDGSVVPYPDMAMNNWAPAMEPGSRFVCVQSVVADRDGYLWVLDPANPKFKGVIIGGPKLVKIDLATNRIVETYRYADPVIEPGSYLNDVRIDTKRKVAYITDSGAGAIIVTDLKTGISRRLLANHPSTQSEVTVLKIEGKPWLRPDGSIPRVNADGIALDPEGKYLYYHALTGRTLYRIETCFLRDPKLTEDEVGRAVEPLGSTGAADGMEYGTDGRVFLTSLEDDAIKTLVPGQSAQIIVQDRKLAWPDTLAWGPDGSLYVTTSQIHRGPHPPEPYRILKLEKRK